MTPQERLVTLVNHLAEFESGFGSLTDELPCKDALVKFVFPEYDIRYWIEEETNDEYEQVVLRELKTLKQELGIVE